jgi:Na+/melibiose symporter-like transporter
MFLFAMACWEGTFAAMRTFVVLYVVEGLDQSLAVSSTILATVAAGYTCAAILAGPIGDRAGAARVVFWSSVVYATGLLNPASPKAGRAGTTRSSFRSPSPAAW